jgi:hypothetical protein
VSVRVSERAGASVAAAEREQDPAGALPTASLSPPEP